jgi:hypothetical protein
MVRDDQMTLDGNRRTEHEQCMRPILIKVINMKSLYQNTTEKMSVVDRK